VVSVVTRAECPHERRVFVWLGDGPWLGDPDDPDYGGYPYVHDTSSEDGRGHLVVCELMPFATPEEAGEVCACGHAAGRHSAAAEPIPAGRLAKPRACDCGCPDFRHWADGKPMWSYRLACGCDFLTHYVPDPGVGAYVSCTAKLAHQTSYRIESVTPVVVKAKPLEAVPAATEIPLASRAPSRPAEQLALFGEARPIAAREPRRRRPERTLTVASGLL
jgi:hypothetical protein